MRKPARQLGHRLERALAELAVFGGLCGLLSGCPATAAEVAPPQYDFYFPTGLAITPDEKYMFVLSANSDLLYSNGAIQVIDLDALDAIANDWQSSGAQPDACTGQGFGPVATRPSVLACPTTLNGGPGVGVVSGAGIQVGSFATAAEAEALVNADGSPSSLIRLFVTVRGDPSITWADFDTANPRLDCGVPGAFTRCDEPHRLARVRNDGDLPSLSAEPFAMALDPISQWLYVTHLTTGTVTLLSAPNTIGSAPVIVDSLNTLWGISTLDGTLGAVGVAPRIPGDPSGLVYVTSRAEGRVSMVHAVPNGSDANGLPLGALVRTGSFFIDGLTTPGDPGDGRNIAFTDNGDHMFVASRLPPALREYDTSLDGTGAPKNLPMGLLEVCDQPSNLALADFGEGPRLALPCFGTGTLWVVDPQNLSLVAVEDTGRGPSGVAASVRHKKIYVGNYAEDTISVIDASPGSPAQFRSIMRLGKLRAVGNN